MPGSDPSAEDIKAHVQTYWNDRAETYDDDSHHAIHDTEQREAWLSVLRTLTGEPPQQILDLGCGTGVISLLLAELGHDVTGVDVSTEMLERAKEKARQAEVSPEFYAGDAEDLDEPENEFDLVTGRHLIWTLPTPASAIQEWQRVVRPGGHIALIEGHWDFPEPFEGYEAIHDDLPLYDGRPPAELAAFLAEHGLEAVEYEPLMDSVLWGDEPNYDQYIAVGTVPR
ncbi:class I SAM-dependent methyltransferase [Natrialba sp. PRR66]|uniref:class I SAM-dependent methyltransferase n=1 Tax=Natrialba sp. PRR66 TaxID=3098146 RepID=UPI002B1E120C|nr:class I SAM-dependent methyltransferase [Natrialba sp. PRR66]